MEIFKTRRTFLGILLGEKEDLAGILNVLQCLKKFLGLPFDIHGGGQDLIFPHHEDEIAQSEAATGKKFVNYWMHNGMVNVDNVKMSKSLGNFKTIRDLLKDYTGEVIRYFVISTQYRKPIDFSKKALEDAKNSYERLKNIISEIER